MRQPRLVTHLGVALVLTLVPPAHGAMLSVANTGLDGPDCGAKTKPCRSISHAVSVRATDGDTIVVGPGKYGDLDGNGILGNVPGEETGGFGCVVLVARAVTITSSDGATSTIIDGSTAVTECNVGIAVDGTKFGKPGKGFMVTNTGQNGGAGIVINATNVAVAGNQVIALGGTGAGVGIDTFDFPQAVLIEGDQVMGWSAGIRTRGAMKAVRRNQVARNCSAGILVGSGSTAVGNVLIANGKLFGTSGGCTATPGPGVDLAEVGSAIGNAAYGNQSGYAVATAFSGTLRANNMVGNTLCGVRNFGVAGLLAADNYWGSATGPGLDPADDVCNDGGGSTTTTPFATKLVGLTAADKCPAELSGGMRQRV